MMKVSMVFTFALSIFVLPFSIIAQEVNTFKEPCKTDYAVSLVSSLAAESKQETKTDKRIKILIRLADFLWDFEEETARKYFTDAFAVASQRFDDEGYENRELSDVNNKGIIIQLPDYRMEVIRAIARKDSKWARELTEQILSDLEENSKK